MRQYTNESKKEFPEEIAATLKIKSNKDDIKNSMKKIEETWNEKLKSEMIYSGDITEISDHKNYFEKNWKKRIQYYQRDFNLEKENVK